MGSLRKNNIYNTTFILMLITFLARFFGLLREVMIADYYGASMYTDAYVIANNIPTVLFETVGAALMTSFIPMYSRIDNEKGQNRANVFTISLIRILFIISMIITILGEVFTREVVFVFAKGFKGEALSTTIAFSRILIPSLFAMTLVNLFSGYLQYYHSFILASLVTVFGNLTIIGSLFVSTIFSNVFIFVWGSLLGICIQVVVLFPFVVKNGLLNGTRQALSSKVFSDEYVKKLLPLLIPVFIGSAVNEINAIVDKNMVSVFEEGTISYFNYSNKIITLIISVVAIPIVTVSFPNLSRLAAASDEDSFSKTVEKGFNLMVFVMMPILVLVLLFRKEIVVLLLQRGNFTEHATINTTRVLVFYSLGLIWIGLRHMLIRVYYSKQDTITPMINGILCAIINVVLNVVLIAKIGFVGAALATSIVAFVGVSFLTCILVKKGIIHWSCITIPFVKVLSPSVLIFLLINWVKNAIMPSNVGVNYVLCGLCLSLITVVVFIISQIVMNNNQLVLLTKKRTEC